MYLLHSQIKKIWSLLFTFLPLSTALSQLRADLYNAAPIPTNATLPDGTVGFWQPTVVTLISGASEAVLIDTLFTSAQAIALADWIEETIPNKRLTTIYITHGHGDHWFNSAYLQTRFPGVQIVSTQASITHMSTQLTSEFRTFWSTLFPSQIPPSSYQILAQPLQDNKFTLEGHVLEAVDVGHSDTDETTFLHIPSLGMVVAGDIVYNDVHMWMTESPTQAQRDAWVRSLDKVSSVNPAIVIGSHHRPGGVDGAFNIAASQTYIRTFGKLREVATSAEDLYAKVLEAYPNRIGKLVLWLGCQAQFPSEDRSGRDEL
ncbi:Metallo-hydrolase/oxidoreductase [Annulohypoxylon maeteangense]|uniref:Metallo-hydrolase/oxidoreductase n=1 Tax=Annulohypoxylon maeteangense TaxID=1927788 RepID=UPI00200803A3|nr:Metallo-hydrolase/oxidoreductase [Annulohypoxylon maeteangense]KAI0884591.1 Metallo-hydrolase/oxidoreductase [Annulohypoxylon maeteangense]